MGNNCIQKIVLCTILFWYQRQKNVLLETGGKIVRGGKCPRGNCPFPQFLVPVIRILSVIFWGVRNAGAHRNKTYMY